MKHRDEKLYRLDIAIISKTMARHFYEEMMCAYIIYIERLHVTSRVRR